MSILTASDKEKLKPRLTTWQSDPAAFIREVWPDAILWDKLEEICGAIANNQRVVVPSCHGSGKSWLAARLALWFLSSFAPSKVITTARSWDQVTNVLWSEIGTAFKTAHLPLGGRLLDVKIEVKDNWFAVGLSPKKDISEQGFGVQRLQGLHSPNMLVIVDEAGGCDADILTAAESLIVAPNNKILMIGNPTRPQGPFYEACISRRWQKIHISAFDCPNVKQGEMIIPGAVSQEWIEDQREHLGEAHPLWKAKVLGEFPDEAEDSLVTLAQIERAAEVRTQKHGPICVGIDPAGAGENLTACHARQGPRTLAIEGFNDADPRGRVIAFLAPYKRPSTVLKVDSTGIGYNFALHLQDQGFTVHMINAGEAARDSERFKNIRAEMAWGLRKRFEDGAIEGLIDKRTIEQILAIRWAVNERGQTYIESKKDMLKRGIASPDFYDACVLAYSGSDVEGLIETQVPQRDRPITAGLALKRF